VRVTNELLSKYQHVISDLKLITGGKGVFDVTVDGTLIYSKAETGRQTNPGEITELFIDLVGPVTPYGE